MERQLGAVGGERRGAHLAVLQQRGVAVIEVEDTDVADDPLAGVRIRGCWGEEVGEAPAVARPGDGYDAPAGRQVVMGGGAGDEVDDHDVGLVDVVVTDRHRGAVGREQHGRWVALRLGSGTILRGIHTAVDVPARAQRDGLGEVEELHAEAVLVERHRGSRRRVRHASGEVRVASQLLRDRHLARAWRLPVVLRAQGDDQDSRAHADHPGHPHCHAHPLMLGAGGGRAVGSRRTYRIPGTRWT